MQLAIATSTGKKKVKTSFPFACTSYFISEHGEALNLKGVILT
jgi:hypothetical protein